MDGQAFSRLRAGPRAATLTAAVVGALILGLVLLQPRLGLLFQASPVIQLHVYAATAALLLGAALMSWTKGRRFHRVGGWVFAGLMAVTAIASLWITGLNGSHWSLIHGLSGWTLIALPLAVFFARTHRVKPHRRFMMGLFYGGLIIAGAFTFVPGRLMYQAFFT